MDHADDNLPPIIKRSRVAELDVREADLPWLAGGRVARHRVQLDGEAEQAAERLEARVIQKHRAPVREATFDVPLLDAPGFTPLDALGADEGFIEGLVAEAVAAEPEPEPVVARAELEALRAEWEAELRAELEAQQAAALEAARREAFAEGQAATRAELQADWDALHATLEAECRRFAEQWQGFLQQAEPALADLAVGVAEQLLDAPLPEAVRGVSSRAVMAAVDRLAGEPPVEVLLHPVDLLRLDESGLTDQLSGAIDGLRWTPSPDLLEGEWVVQSPTAAIRRLRDELVQDLRRELGLLAGDDE